MLRAVKEYLQKTIPLLITLAMAWFFQNSVEGVKLPQSTVTPIPEEKGQTVSQLLTPTPYINSLIVIIVVFVGSMAMIALLRYRRVVRLIILSIFFIAATTATTFYLLLLTDLDMETILILSVTAAMVAVAAISARSEIASVLAASYLASSSGVILGSSIPFWTSIVLLVAISVYDLLAVFKGHLKTIGQLDTDSIKGLVVDFRGVSIGLGDLFFYTVLYSFVMTNLGVLPAAVAVIGLSTGYVLTLKLAEKRPVFPGLPITILTALALSLITYSLSLIT